MGPISSVRKRASADAPHRDSQIQGLRPKLDAPHRDSQIQGLRPKLDAPHRDSQIQGLRPKLDAPHRDSQIQGLRPKKASTLPEDAAARRLVDALVRNGVDTFFGVPGGPICPFFEAVRLDSRATMIESRHESHAAFSAVAYARATGAVPAVVVTAGPGVTNAVTGIASAHLERVSMLVIAGDVAWTNHGGRLAQDSGPEGIDIERLLAPI